MALYYRVFPFLAHAKVGEPGHPQYLHKPQGGGRLDNPRYYDVWYLAAEMSGAAGEVFGDLTTWSKLMFDFPKLPGAVRALGTYELSDNLPLLDLDDAQNLVDRGLRPTQVVERNRAATQAWALRIWQEYDPGTGLPKWVGIRWWSFHRPQWRVLGVWGATPRCLAVATLDTSSPAIVDAARQLGRVIS
jgi:RES domain